MESQEEDFCLPLEGTNYTEGSTEDSPRSSGNFEGFFHEPFTPDFKDLSLLSNLKKEKKTKNMSSYEVFVSFASLTEGKSELLSTQCLQKWIETRRNGVKNPSHSFRKALIAHLCGRDGRKPFSEEIENLVLEELAQKTYWPSLEDAPLKLIGKGFRGLAYHESLRQEMKKDISQKRPNDSSSYSSPPTFQDFQPIYHTEQLYRPNIKKFRIDPLDQFITNTPSGIYMTNEHEEYHFSSVKDELEESCPLETFEDVRYDEIQKVIAVREETKEIYADYLVQINSETDIFIEKLPPDICGDVRLLRFLRACKGDVKKTVQEISSFLKWRKKNGVERIRMEIEEENLSAEQLKKKLTIRARHSFLPFFRQDDNGDILELYKLQPSQDKYTGFMVEYLRAHTVLCEFRSSLLDRLSRAKRRMVKIKVILDLAVIDDTEYWWYTLRLWAWYLTRFSQLYLRWNPDMISKVFLFGQGSMLQRISGYLLPRLVYRFFDGEVSLLLTPEEQERVLMAELGDVAKRPQSFGGHILEEMCDSLREKKVFSVGAR